LQDATPSTNGINVPECRKVEFFNEGLLTLHIQADLQELNKLKGLPSSGDKTFAINAKADLVCLLCEACWLISFDLHSQTGGYSPNEGRSLAARLTFGFKYSDKDELWPLIKSEEEALKGT